METVESKSFEVPVVVLLKTPNFWDILNCVFVRVVSDISNGAEMLSL